MSIEETSDMGFWSKMKEVLSEVFTSAQMAEEPAEIEPTNIDLEEQQPTAQEPKVEEPKVEEPKVEEPVVEEPKVEEPVVEEPKPQEEPKQEEAPVEQPKDNHLEELINNLKDEIAALKEMNTGLQEKIKDLGSQPSANPINVNAKPNGANVGVGSSSYQAWREQMAKYI